MNQCVYSEPAEEDRHKDSYLNVRCLNDSTGGGNFCDVHKQYETNDMSDLIYWAFRESLPVMRRIDR